MAYALRAEGWDRRKVFEAFERAFVLCRCNASWSARELGISRQTLRNWLQEFPALAECYLRVKTSLDAREVPQNASDGLLSETGQDMLSAEELMGGDEGRAAE